MIKRLRSKIATRKRVALPATPTIVMTGAFWEKLYRHLIRVAPEKPYVDEQLAFILARASTSPLGLRLLACEMVVATPDDFTHQSSGGLQPKAEFVAAVIKRCRAEDWHLIEVHSHPFDRGSATTFSMIDWANDREKMPALAAIIPEPFMHATIVMGQKALDAHFYQRQSKKIIGIDQVIIVGKRLHHLTTTAGRDKKRAHADIDERYQRQTLFFGSLTQKKLARSTVAIVGLGGLGSFVALQLAHLGVGHLILIDPDRVERTNLNRLLGAKEDDIGLHKVAVYEQMIRKISEATQVTALPLSLIDREDHTAIDYAKGADIIVGCVDNDGARLILNQLAARYLIPLVDGGTGIHLPEGDEPPVVGGQVQVVLPGSGCLECRGYIHPQRAQFDLAPVASQKEARLRGYGTDEVAPSVISLNGVIASQQVAEVLQLLSVDHSPVVDYPPLSIYDALKRRLTPVRTSCNESCPTCGTQGVVGVGDFAPIEFASTSLSEDAIAAILGGEEPDTGSEDAEIIRPESKVEEPYVEDGREEEDNREEPPDMQNEEEEKEELPANPGIALASKISSVEEEV